MPKISVIIPAYNHEKYIAATIDSILAQSFSDFEIVAIDDGSPDHTGEILDAYACKDARVHVYHQKNVGVAETSNRGIQYATGEWIAFCGSDDTYPPRALEHLLKKSDQMDVVIGEYTCRSDRGLSQYMRYRRRRNSFTGLMFASGAMWGKLFRRTFLVEHQLYFPTLTMEEDVVFIAQMAVLSPQYSIVRKNTYYYWNHDGDGAPSLTHRSDINSFEQRLRGKQMMLDIFREHYFTADWETHFIGSALTLADYLLGLFQPQDRERAFALFCDFLFQYDWSGKDRQFEGYFNMRLDEMLAGGIELFYQRNMQFDLKDRIYYKFATGQIGFRYIIKYMEAWARFKLSLYRKRGG
ncbi:glycosyltransferase family 2 protein [Harryflintia acetispora]|uniref:Glycosyl transferase family 2 n=1 Tax=Harryflintia acetispora TaxID=1849041 RepID=A0A9X8Y7L3_9FIRM|nr:glycosyltransferase family 2 protein [Harryflintia acetispora]TCL42569.1 glycosyl transferase family 2 [Harryflintia acetispora]